MHAVHNYADDDISKEVLKATTIENDDNKMNDEMHVNDDDDLKGEIKTISNDNEDNQQNDSLSEHIDIGLFKKIRFFL